MRLSARAFSFTVALVAMLCLVLQTTPGTRAADPYEINAILSLTGPGAFIGTNQAQALKALEGLVNRGGGISGRPVSFVIADDQSSPQISLQLAQGLVAKRVSIILGPSLAASCQAIMPLITKDGPLLYCLTTFLHPDPGSFVFATLPSAEAQEGAVLRYFRDRGLHRIACVFTTDESGKAAEVALLQAANAPANKAVKIVDREYFGTSDFSAAAQVANLKAANPDAVFAWATGTAAGTLFRNLRDAGVNLPTATSGASLNAAFFKQYGPLLPTSLYFAGLPLYSVDTLSDRATKTALTTMTAALQAVNDKPDQVKISAWDPAYILIEALRKVGTDAGAAKLRDYVTQLHGWVGANGPYDFRSAPQRGVGEGTVVVVKWDPTRNDVVPVSEMGGAPLPKQ